MSKNWNKRFRNILITGMPASGKSTFGKVLAYHLKRDFVDVDTLVERSFKKTIAQIFLDEGEEAFRAAENRTLRKLQRTQNCIISLGGGALSHSQNLSFARGLGVLVFLETPLDVISERIFAQREVRPMFSTCNSVAEVQEKLSALWLERQETYESAELRLSTSYSSFDNLVLQILSYERKAFQRDYQAEVSIIEGAKTSWEKRRTEEKIVEHSEESSQSHPEEVAPDIESHEHPIQETAQTPKVVADIPEVAEQLPEEISSPAEVFEQPVIPQREIPIRAPAKQWKMKDPSEITLQANDAPRIEKTEEKENFTLIRPVIRPRKEIAILPKEEHIPTPERQEDAPRIVREDANSSPQSDTQPRIRYPRDPNAKVIRAEEKQWNSNPQREGEKRTAYPKKVHSDWSEIPETKITEAESVPPERIQKIEGANAPRRSAFVAKNQRPSRDLRSGFRPRPPDAEGHVAPKRENAPSQHPQAPSSFRFHQQRRNHIERKGPGAEGIRRENRPEEQKKREPVLIVPKEKEELK